MRFHCAVAIVLSLILLPGSMKPMAAQPGRLDAGNFASAGELHLLPRKSFASQHKTAGRGRSNISIARLTVGPAVGDCPEKCNPGSLDGLPAGTLALVYQSSRHAGFNFSGGQLTARIWQHWQSFASWLRATYKDRPILVISLSTLVLLPFLALPGLFLGWRMARGISAAQSSRRNSGPPLALPPPTLGPAWIKIEGKTEGRGSAMTRITGEMLRIGRESDNDVCLQDRSVHRYHALIHRSPDAEYFITDISGASGNGIWVNGIKQRAVALYSGDLIRLGGIDVRFERGHGEA